MKTPEHDYSSYTYAMFVVGRKQTMNGSKSFSAVRERDRHFAFTKTLNLHTINTQTHKQITTIITVPYLVDILDTNRIKDHFFTLLWSGAVRHSHTREKMCAQSVPTLACGVGVWRVTSNLHIIICLRYYAIVVSVKNNVKYV